MNDLAPNPEKQARLLRHALWNFATQRNTAQDLERFDAAWDEVEAFPVQLNGVDYTLGRNALKLALGSCGEPQIIGVALTNETTTVEYSPQTLFRNDIRFRILPPSLVTAGVQ